MSVFSDAEIDYLGSQRLGRLATVGQDGMPHVVPVAFRYNPDTDSIDVGGHDFAKRKKFRDVKRTGMAALVVDDVLPPWQPRAVECAARRAPSTPAARSSWRASTTRSSGSHRAGSSPGAWRTASRRVRWSDPTSDRQLRSLVLGVDLVGSRRIWPSHVGRVVDPDGSSRVPSDRLDDQTDDQAREMRRPWPLGPSPPPWTGHQIFHLVTPGGLPPGLPRADAGVSRSRDALALPCGSGPAQPGRRMTSWIVA